MRCDCFQMSSKRLAMIQHLEGLVGKLKDHLMADEAADEVSVVLFVLLQSTSSAPPKCALIFTHYEIAISDL